MDDRKFERVEDLQERGYLVDDDIAIGSFLNWRMLYEHVEDGDDVPIPREQATMGYWQREEALIVFGGKDESARNVDDMWMFKLSETEWTQLFPTGDRPVGAAAMDGAGVVVEDCLFYAGRMNHVDFGVYCCDLLTMDWKRCDRFPNTIIEGHTVEYIPHQRSLLIFFGRQIPNRHLNTVVEFDVDAQVFRRGNLFLGVAPPQSAFHSSTLAGRSVFVFGGVNRNGVLNDLHFLDTDTYTWNTPIVVGDIPYKREHASLDAFEDCLILFGGHSEFMNHESYVFDTQTSCWTGHPWRPPEDLRQLGGHSTLSLDGNLLVFGGAIRSESVVEIRYYFRNQLWSRSVINDGYTIFRNVISKGGACAWGRAKFMILGQGRVGKTSSIKALLGQDFNPHEESTLGVDASKVASFEEDWNADDALKSEAFRHALRAVAIRVRENRRGQAAGPGPVQSPVSPTTVNETNEDDRDDEEEKEDIFLYDDDNDDDDEAEAEEEDEMGLEVIPDINNEEEEVNARRDEELLQEFDQALLDKELGRTELEVVFNLWDYGGQPVFHSLHHLFLTEFGLYALCFSLKDLSAEALSELQYWYGAVKLYAPKSPFMFIGTFADEVHSKKYNAINTKLEKALRLSKKNPYLLRDVQQGRWFFPLDNKTGKGADAIRTCATVAARNQAFVQQKVPLQWIQIFDTLRQRDVWTIRDVMDVSRAFSVEGDELNLMLGFFHELGAIWHFIGNKKLSKFVIANPQWIIDALTCIIFDEIHSPKDLVPEPLSEDFETFTTTGIFSYDLARFLWREYEDQVRFLLALMKTLQLICEWDETHWLVPSRLRTKADTNPMHGGGRKIVWKSLLEGVPIDGVYQRLVSLCVPYSRKNSEPPLLDAQRAYFVFGRPGDPPLKFKLSWSSDPCTITVEMDDSCDTEESARAVTRKINKSIRKIDALAFRGKLKMLAPATE